MLKKLKAFTIMELLIVVVLMGIIAAFGLPNYNNSRQKADEREAIDNLRLIASAMETYNMRNDGVYPALVGANVNAINTALNLGIIEVNMVYLCTSNLVYTCWATSPDLWVVRSNNTADSGEPFCSAGACPTCVLGGCPQ